MNTTVRQDPSGGTGGLLCPSFLHHHYGERPPLASCAVYSFSSPPHLSHTFPFHKPPMEDGFRVCSLLIGKKGPLFLRDCRAHDVHMSHLVLIPFGENVPHG